jgi:hypothetical protein
VPSLGDTPSTRYWRWRMRRYRASEGRFRIAAPEDGLCMVISAPRPSGGVSKRRGLGRNHQWASAARARPGGREGAMRPESPSRRGGSVRLPCAAWKPLNRQSDQAVPEVPRTLRGERASPSNPPIVAGTGVDGIRLRGISRRSLQAGQARRFIRGDSEHPRTTLNIRRSTRVRGRRGYRPLSSQHSREPR